MYLDRLHAYPTSELHLSVVDGRAGPCVAHDRSDVADPDLVGKVQRKKAVGPSGGIGERAWQHRGTVGRKDRLLGRKRPELRVKVPLNSGNLGHRLDHEVRVVNGVCEIRRISDPIQRVPRASAGRSLDLTLVPCRELRETLPGLVDDLVADVVGRDREAAVSGLIRDLRTEDPSSEHCDVVDAYGHVVLLKNSVSTPVQGKN